MAKVFQRSESHVERLGTFFDWPPGLKQTPEDLAGAGFRYTQLRDKVRCDTCGGKLYNWRENDDPVIEHMRYFPECEFLKRFIEKEAETDKHKKAEVASQSTLSKPSEPAVHQERVRHNSTVSETPTSSPKVDKKWLRSQMDRPLTQIVLSRGYSRKDVKKVISEHFEKTHSEFADAASLLKAIYELEEREERSRTFAHVALCSSDEARDGKQTETAASSEIPSSSGDNFAVKSAEATRCDKSHPRAEFAPPVSKSNSRKNDSRAQDSVKESKASGKLCVVCREKEMGAMFLPCEHLCVCPDCAVRVSECPTCKMSVQHRLRVYLG